MVVVVGAAVVVAVSNMISNLREMVTLFSTNGSTESRMQEGKGTTDVGSPAYRADVELHGAIQVSTCQHDAGTLLC